MVAEPGGNRHLLPKPAAPRSAPAAVLLPVIDRVRAAAGRLSLRAKFLLSLVLVILTMTFCTLLAVRQLIEVRAERQLALETHNALATFQVMSRQQHMALSRKAELLATLALLRDGDKTAIQEASQDPWQSEDCDLFAFTDAAGKITELQTRGDITASSAHDAIGNLLRASNASSSREARKPILTWWVNGTHLYQIVVTPFDPDQPAAHSSSAKVIVGHELDAPRVKEFARILSADLVFRQGTHVVASSLSPFEEQQVATVQLSGADSSHIVVRSKHYSASSLKLIPDAPDDLNLLVLKSDDAALASIGRLNLLLVLLGVAAVLVGGLLVYFISSTFTKPLGSLMEGVRALEQGDCTYPLAAVGGDELSTLTRAFESMRSTLQGNEAQRKQLEGELRQSQKMDALGRLAGGVAHDFNNLLTIIKGNSDLALDHIKTADPARANCEQISKVADRAAALTRQLLAFSRRQLLQPRVLDLNDLVMESSRLLKRLLREDIEFNVRCADSLGRVLADPGQIEQVLLNLTVNAADAMPSGGKLVIETANITVDDAYSLSHPPLQPGRYVMLTVTDSGSGMSAEIKARIFEPFFTTKEPGKGTGLGLATVYGIVNQSSGCIYVDSSPGAGTRFEIYLPQTLEKLPAAHSEALSAQQRHRETVLLVEDESAVRTLTCEFLQAAGYQVLSAADGVEALEIAERLGGAIHILLTDVVMPRMRGPELARLIQQKLPRLITIFVSGYTEELHATPSLMDNGFFLQKPFSRDQLLRKLNDAIHSEKLPRSHRSERLPFVV